MYPDNRNIREKHYERQVLIYSAIKPFEDKTSDRRHHKNTRIKLKYEKGSRFGRSTFPDLLSRE